MKIKSKTLFQFMLGFLLVAAVACKKDTKCTAGTGGNLTLVAYLQHHEKTIPNQGNYPDSVFVKFNTQEYPGDLPGNYDIYFVGDSGKDYVHLKNLRCGNYYLFGTAYDTTSGTTGMRVFGGRPFSTSTTSGEIGINIAVTE